MEITPETFVAAVAARNPATIRVFQSYGIDFCCGGKRPLAEVCEEKQVPFEELRSSLEAAMTRSSELPAADAPLGTLVHFIVERYHTRLREELPRLGEMAAKVLSVHGERHPDLLPDLHATFVGLREELEDHMAKEERILFPYALRLEETAARGGSLARATFGSIDAPIGVLEHEHELAGAALAKMRELTGDYVPPAGACTTFRGLYHGLAELDRELREHIHLENNVLFPRAARLERQLLGQEEAVSLGGSPGPLRG